jgi:hypothetical protein
MNHDNAAMPESFKEEDASLWAEWILQNGLPPLPLRLEKGMSVPLARWIGHEYAGVLFVEWAWSEDPQMNDLPDRLVSTVHSFVYAGDEGWLEFAGVGGTGWCDPPFERPQYLSTDVRWYGFNLSVSDRGRCGSWYGIVGPGVRYLQLVDRAGLAEAAIESPIGAFVVSFDAGEPCSILFLSEDRAPVSSKRYDP